MHPNTRTHRLIGDTGLQLSERPRVECCALRPSSPDPRANMRQIFDGNRPLRAFGLRNNPFGENVVDVFGKPALLTGQLPQTAAAAACAELLELVPQPPMAIAHVLERSSAVDLPVAIRGDVRYTQVDAKHIVNITWLRGFDLGSGEQIPVASYKRQIGFAAPEGKQLALPLATHKRDVLPSVTCPDRSSSVLVGVGEDAIIIGNRATWRKRALCLPIQLVRIRDFGDTAHRELGGEAKRLTHRTVGQPVDWKLAKRFAVPRHLTDVVTGSVRRLKCALQGVRLFGCGKEFQLDRQSHNMSIVPDTNVCVNGSQPQSGRHSCRRSRIPLPPKVGSFLRSF